MSISLLLLLFLHKCLILLVFTAGYLNQHAGMMPAPLSLNRSLLTSKGYRGSPVDTGYDMDGRPFTKRRPPPSSGRRA